MFLANQIALDVDITFFGSPRHTGKDHRGGKAARNGIFASEE